MLHVPVISSVGRAWLGAVGFNELLWLEDAAYCMMQLAWFIAHRFGRGAVLTLYGVYLWMVSMWSNAASRWYHAAHSKVECVMQIVSWKDVHYHLRELRNAALELQTAAEVVFGGGVCFQALRKGAFTVAFLAVLFVWQSFIRSQLREDERERWARALRGPSVAHAAFIARVAGVFHPSVWRIDEEATRWLPDADSSDLE